ncbi:hypothetical protein [Chondromyces crocatus]|uniref:Uncharacterized protein n=1 Tax=Chondromyces crocatus TaxID=52 RepID=A0A0K1EN41_CHOCO|nr:hypothetical protein [Chondromyces crocatus]AKT42047.1 uncharacterized protein CMC5_062700 [Chondromyces crocatus]
MVRWSEVQKAADQLGFSSHGNKASGRIQGRRVSLELDGFDHHAQLFVRGWLSPPLDLGLSLLPRATARQQQGRLAFDELGLDRAFLLEGDEPARIRSLLTPPLREQLLALHRASYDLRLDDSGCTLSTRLSVGIGPAWIIEAATATAKTIHLIESARETLEPAAPLALHAPGLRTLAATHHLTFTTTPLAASRRADGRWTGIRSARTDRGRHHLIVRINLDPRHGLSPAARKEPRLDPLRSLLGGSAPRIVDDAFARRFHLTSPLQGRSLIASCDPFVREALLAVDDRVGTVLLDDHGIHVEQIEPAILPETLTWAFNTLLDVRQRLERKPLHSDVDSSYH